MLDSVVLKKLQQVRPQVGPAKQKILDFVLSEPERVVHMSITELAELAGVSERPCASSKRSTSRDS